MYTLSLHLILSIVFQLTVLMSKFWIHMLSPNTFPKIAWLPVNMLSQITSFKNTIIFEFVCLTTIQLIASSTNRPSCHKYITFEYRHLSPIAYRRTSMYTTTTASPVESTTINSPKFM